jgi:hypothetical protein
MDSLRLLEARIQQAIAAKRKSPACEERLHCQRGAAKIGPKTSATAQPVFARQRKTRPSAQYDR